MGIDVLNVSTPISSIATVSVAAIAVIGYIIAFATPSGAAAILIALPALCLLARQRTAWRTFGIGLVTGGLISATLLFFFVKLFGVSAAGLWLVGALPFGVFLTLLYFARQYMTPTWALCWTPILWTGTEYFRSEVWPLRFAWLLPGQAAALLPGVRFETVGVYGLGFIYMAIAALAVGPTKQMRLVGTIGLAIAASLMYWPPLPPTPRNAPLQIAGVQTEYWEVPEIAAALDQLAVSQPDAQILVLSELAFSGPVPPEIRDVVRKHKRYLVAGGTTPTDGGDFYNTAFVVGPDGADVFSQVKSVPIQFRNSGAPATERRVWDSPWGKIGIAICYDASYVRVMDDFVRQGACGLIIPTMDVAKWGEFERRMLHARVQPVRSAEYGIPTFGVWSSGISQLTDRYGRIIATAGYPGLGDTIAGPFDLSQAGRIPPDRTLAMASLAATGLFIVNIIRQRFRRVSSLREESRNVLGGQKINIEQTSTIC
jgi:apolipoprotein N-acyltransferase